VQDDAERGAAVGSVPTVFLWTARYWHRKWPTLEPKGRAQLARYLNRARRWLVDVEPEGSDRADVEAYIAEASLTAAVVAVSAPAERGGRWLGRHSLPIAEVGRHELEALVERFSVNQRDPSRRVAATSVRRMVADLRPCWDRAVVEEVIPANPWKQVDLGLRALRGGKRTATGVVAADADLVLDPAHVWNLAEACAINGTWGSSVRAFVLVMGFCGLRPNEAAGLVIEDLDVDTDGPGWLTVRRNHRRVAGRFLDTDEDPTWGPLKGRGLAERRQVPVPTTVAAALRQHLTEHRSGAGAHGLVFERHGHPFDLSNFNADVWVPGRAALFPLDANLPPDSPLQPKLARLRRHDLRHSACSTWLRAGIDVTVCQKWSGHKRLSVFLDVYQGVMPGREAAGVRSLERLLLDVGRGVVE
jgi:integrase